MFEKEAIIHAFEATIGIECLNKPVEDYTYEDLTDEQQEKAYDFKQGAEFGYNKCKEELNHKGLALQSDMDKTIEQNIALKKELNKANEWHKADILPSQINKVVLGYIKDYNSKMLCLVKWNGEWWYDARTYNERVKLIAWREIELPK